mgnify:FL=1|tara:strand:- start:99 stop:1157 length:1059 start_codon:yes stop_codon:yes gene_type:complete
MKCVILAGGSGSRFWPLSRRDKPKQLLNIVGNYTMLQMTVDRLVKMKRVTDIYIITRADLRESIIDNVKSIKPENIIAEPNGKNTAPAIGLICTIIGIHNKDSVVGIFPADHLIIGHNEFEQAINTSEKLAIATESMITLGVQPSHPSTAYGYIQYDDSPIRDYPGAYKVKTFAEKPHYKLAERFIRSGDFLWNAGMFIWQIKTLMGELKKHMPDLYESLQEINKRIKKNKPIDEIWDYVSPESIDYGLLEKSSNIYVVSCGFQWNDLGSWNALYDVLAKNDDGNIIRGNGKILEGTNNFIHSEGKFTAVVGVDDLVVVNTEDVTLVVHRDKVEMVKDMVEILKKGGEKNLL